MVVLKCEKFDHIPLRGEDAQQLSMMLLSSTLKHVLIKDSVKLIVSLYYLYETLHSRHKPSFPLFDILPFLACKDSLNNAVVVKQ